jgi:hypothetical protein
MQSNIAEQVQEAKNAGKRKGDGRHAECTAQGSGHSTWGAVSRLTKRYPSNTRPKGVGVNRATLLCARAPSEFCVQRVTF